jgi:hypothetical protein
MIGRLIRFRMKDFLVFSFVGFLAYELVLGVRSVLQRAGCSTGPVRDAGPAPRFSRRSVPVTDRR